LLPSRLASAPTSFQTFVDFAAFAIRKQQLNPIRLLE
jgi:hypothetical protein